METKTKAQDSASDGFAETWLQRARQRGEGRGGDDDGFIAPSRRVQLVRNRAMAASLLQRGGRPVFAGWIPDLPDHRDSKEGDDDIEQPLNAVRKKKPGLPLPFDSEKLPKAVNNHKYCSPIEDQGQLGSCTAQAVVGLLEYEMRRHKVPHVDGSRLFVYKTTRNLLGWKGDTGAYLRSTIKAAATFGVPPEDQWPYNVEHYEEEPSAYLYAYAQNYKALKYVRLDPPGNAPGQVLTDIKRVLAAGYGVVFGFTCYESLGNGPDIPFPSRNDRADGGHAVMAVGYNDEHMVNGKKIGSLIIRNSWGEGWGIKGYGFLPYEYVKEGLADDFWTVFNSIWLEQSQFEES